MAGYITSMTAPLSPQVRADLHKACKHDPLAANTIDMLISEINRVSELIAAVAPACTDPVVAFNTQFLPADLSPQEPVPRCKMTCSFGEHSPDPRFNCQRQCKRAIGHAGMHQCLLPRHPADHDQHLDENGVWQPPRLGGTPYTGDDGDHTPPPKSASLPTQSIPGQLPAAKRSHDPLSDTNCAIPAQDCYPRTDASICDTTLFDTDASTISFDNDDGSSAVDDSVCDKPCAEYDALNHMLRRKFGGKQLDQLRLHGSTGLAPAPMPTQMSLPNVPPQTDGHTMIGKQAGTGDDRHEKQAPSREHQAPGPRARRLICTYNGLTSQGRRPDQIQPIGRRPDRPTRLPPGCHVCHIEYTLHAEHDHLVMCNHPDGCGQLAHMDTCAKACPQHPDKTICNHCRCREHVFTPAPAFPYEERPDYLPPGCHVCNVEHTLHAQDDHLVLCNHPDGCGQVAHPDTCARACPQYPDLMICNACYRPERVLEARPDLVSTSTTMPSSAVWALLGDVWYDDDDSAPTWAWSPQVTWSPAADRFQGHIVGTPGVDHICNPYCVHSYGHPRAQSTPLTPLQLRLQALLRTAQNLAECHTMLANRDADSYRSDNAKRRKKGD